MIWFGVEWGHRSLRECRVSFPDLAKGIEFSFPSDKATELQLTLLASEIIDLMIENSKYIPRPMETASEVELSLPTSMRLALYWASQAAGRPNEEAAMGLVNAFGAHGRSKSIGSLVNAARRYVAILDEAKRSSNFSAIVVIKSPSNQAA